jgi:hypothetical protein
MNQQGGAMEEKVELGSAEWVQLAGKFLEERVASLGNALDGVSWSACQVLKNAPAHLSSDGSGQAAWWYSIDGPTVRFGEGILKSADKTVEGDYQTILPMARVVYDSSPGSEAQRQADQAAIKRLTSQSSPDGNTAQAAAAGPAMPDQLRQTLLELHDYLAVRTA